MLGGTVGIPKSNGPYCSLSKPLLGVCHSNMAISVKWCCLMIESTAIFDFDWEGFAIYDYRLELYCTVTSYVNLRLQRSAAPSPAPPSDWMRSPTPRVRQDVWELSSDVEPARNTFDG